MCRSLTAVGEFRKLALLAEQDGHLRQKLQQVLKLSKEKWDDARDHAMRAVVADNRMRIWCGLAEGCSMLTTVALNECLLAAF
jgi:hypothetical protein